MQLFIFTLIYVAAVILYGGENCSCLRGKLRSVGKAWKSMADHTNTLCSEEQIQSMVRDIFGQLLEAEQSGQGSGQHSSVASKINQRFCLPRNMSTHQAEPQAVNRAVSAVNNVNMPIQSGPDRSTSRSSLPINMPLLQTLSVPSYNPQLNYGNFSRSGPIRPRRFPKGGQAYLIELSYYFTNTLPPSINDDRTLKTLLHFTIYYKVGFGGGTLQYKIDKPVALSS